MLACSGRYGEETPGLSRAQNGGAPAGGNPFGFNDDFDPEQLFNMFFNGGFGGAGFGGPRWGDRTPSLPQNIHRCTPAPMPELHDIV